MNNKWKDVLRNMLIWAAVVLVLGFVWSKLKVDTTGETGVPYTDMIREIQNDQVGKIVLENGRFRTFSKSGGTEGRGVMIDDPHFVDDALAHDVTIIRVPPAEQSMLMQVFISWFPMLLLIVVWIIFMKRMQGGGGVGGNSFGKSKAKMLEENKMTVKFTDVAGCDEAKEEVWELVDFLRDPAKYQKLGGIIPRGILMVGPPGTGKTLLARAIAGEAGVRFFTISGSDFVEMFVGVGASRVRDMFTQAKEHAPCIIFIDEIDAVGRQRGGAGLGGGNDEREQTLNALLVEMDGFDTTTGVVVIAATNRADVLDKALLRPGRFDRQVTVGLPDVKGREQILRVHLRKVPQGDDVEPKYIAQGTPGFSGADIANIVNEAALLAARTNKRAVSMADLEKAKDKILMGAERATMVMTDEDKKLTAYHEAGHCIVGELSPEHDPVYKVSIMPRGRALGVTMFLPERDQYSANKRKLESQIASLFGGRIAEDLIYGGEFVTTGASNDIERATELARNMVTKWGLGKTLVRRNYSEDRGQSFMGHSTEGGKVSSGVAEAIDKEIDEIIDRNYEKAQNILKENIAILHKMTDALMKWETINKDQINDLMSGKDAREPIDAEEIIASIAKRKGSSEKTSEPVESS